MRRIQLLVQRGAEGGASEGDGDDEEGGREGQANRERRPVPKAPAPIVVLRGVRMVII